MPTALTWSYFASEGTVVATPAIVASFSSWKLFLVFLKIGSVVFGSGYVLLAFLRADLVLHRAWVTDAQLVDAVAIGQVTPGPVFTTATACRSALTGVGATMAAGNQLCMGITAFLAKPNRNRANTT